MRFAGEPFQVAAAVQTSIGRNTASVSAARNLLLYRPMPEVTSEAAWFDRSGRRMSIVAESKNVNSVALSPAGEKAVMVTTPLDGNGALWIHDLSGNVATPLAKVLRIQRATAAWSPDGRHVASATESDTGYSVFTRDVDGARPDSRVFTAPLDQAGVPRVEDWTSNGKHLILITRAATPGDQAINGELHLLPADGSNKPIRLTHSGSNVNIGSAALSPDDKWIAYATDESGSTEIYVREFKGAAGLGARWKISTDGGTVPKWRRDGAELFYLDARGTLMAVPIRPGATFRTGPPVRLFAPAPGFYNVSYDVTRDGQRFLAVVPNESILRVPMVLISNWLRR
jgi:eukaryotic-like serine/threonine-protein kinase